MAPESVNDVSQRPGHAPLPSDQPAFVATELNGLALLSTIPVARLDAVRILAMALVRALESGSEGDPGRGVGINLRDEVQRFEANLLKSALAYTGGRQRRAARLLGINVSTMNERIKRYKVNLTELKAG
jgi:DNA-binding NtrC family response regulator